MTPLLETRRLTRHFGGLRAVHEVDFILPREQIHGLIGPNGAGKTTLVSLLCGRLAPTSGTILFEGADITAVPAHRRVDLGIAYTFQITSIYAGLSVLDNVALPVQHRLARTRARRSVTAESLAALDRLGLADFALQRAGALSYGHQRLLEIAMGLALDPKLLILDEPTQGLSNDEIAGFMRLVRDLSASTTVLLIEHNMDVVMALAEHITVLDFGEILATGTPDEIRADPAVQTAYLGA